MKELFKKSKLMLIILLTSLVVFTTAIVVGLVIWLAGGDVSQEDPAYQAFLAFEKEKRPKPKLEDLASVSLFDASSMFNLGNDADSGIKILKIDNVLMYCYQEVPEVKEPLMVIDMYKIPLRELVSLHFQGVSIESITSPEGREGVKTQLLQKMNNLIKTNEEIDSDLIFNIVIENWVYG